MRRTIQKIHFLISLVFVVMLVGCSSGEDRQAEYFESAQELFDSGDFETARLQLRNVLQIDAAHPEARYLVALLDEREQNWKEMLTNLLIAVELDPSYIDARIKLAQMYFRGQAYEAAMEQAEAVLALDPDNADGHTLRGGVFYRQGDTAAAIDEANVALAAEPGHVGAISILTEVYKGEDPGLALAAIGEGLTLQTEVATLKQLKISVLEEQGDAEGVIEIYQELIADHPDNLYFHYRLVTFLEQQERIDEAEVLLRDIVKATPDNLQLKLWLAEFLANQRNLDLAAATAIEFIEKQPEIYELRFALGTIYTVQGNYEEAEVVYTEVIALDVDGADSQRARNELVKLLLARGEVDAAQVLLDEILDIEPENTDALTARAQIELSQGRVSEAIVHLRTVVRDDPSSVQALLLLGQAHEDSGSANLALDNYRNALAAAPTNAQAVIKVAGLLIAVGELEAADRVLERFLLGNPAHAQASHLLAESYGRQGRWEDALAVADGLEASEQNKAFGIYLKGRLLYAKKYYSGSLEAFAQVLELEPSAIEALEYLTRSYLALGREEEAFEYLEQQVEKHPDQAHAQEQLAALHLYAGQAEEAIASYQAALAIAPDRLSAVVGLAGAFAASGDMQATLDAYDKALELSPDNVTLMTLKADRLVVMEQYQQAADLYEAILAIDGRQKVAANNLAMVLVDRIPTEQGLQRAEEITAGFGETTVPTFWDTRGWVLHRLGEYERALPLQKRAVASNSVTNSFRYHLGMTYLKMNDTDSARAEFEASLEDGDDYYGAEFAREMIREYGLGSG